MRITLRYLHHRRLGAILLIAFAMVTASFAGSDAVSAASSRRATAYTREGDEGGWIYAHITWTPNKDGKTYRGRVVGAYEDLEADGYCVLGMRSGSGGKKWYPLGPAVCPKGASHRFSYRFKKAREATVQVCLVTKTGRWYKCSGPA